MLDDPYAGIADRYDFLLNPFLDGPREKVADICSSLGAQQILDVCCGTARQAKWCMMRGITYTGCDISAAMLAQGRKRYAGAPSSACLVEADAIALPFSAYRFDIALLCFALHEKPVITAENILTEAFRVARKVLVVDYALAERNIQLVGQLLMKIPERIAGGEHWACYRRYMHSGALQGMTHRLGLSYEIICHLFWGGAVVALLEQ